MGYNSRKIKDRAIELEEGYDEARTEALKEMIEEEISNADHTEMDIDFFQGILDNFTFPDSMTWAFDQVQSELDDIGDQKHEEARDREMGL